MLYLNVYQQTEGPAAGHVFHHHRLHSSRFNADDIAELLGRSGIRRIGVWRIKPKEKAR